jgi:ABC-type uncharacterized transport system permease subunit
MENLYLLAAALLYAVCALLPSSRRSLVSAVTALAWLAHGAALWTDVAAGSVRVGFAMMLSSAMWISVAAYWVENRNLALDSLRRLVMPCAFLAVMLPYAFPGTLLQLKGAREGWHIAIAIAAFSSLTIAAFHAVLMALQQSRLHTRGQLTGSGGWLGAALDQLPALLTMEKLLFRLIGFGFVLLTLTVLSGIVFSEQLFGTALKWDHKSVFTLLSWILFAVLLAGRRWRGWRGKTALGFTLAGFATLMLAYVASRFVYEVLLHRGFV